MKRFLILLFAFLLTVPLIVFAAAANEPISEITAGGVTYTIDRINRTVYDGSYTYKYSITGTPTNWNMTLTYPDGSKFIYEREAGKNIVTGTGNVNERVYASSQTLYNILADQLPKNPPAPAQNKIDIENILCAVLLCGLGAWQLAKPEFFAKAQVIFWVRNAEPSDFAIFMTRLVGALCVFAGILLLFM